MSVASSAASVDPRARALEGLARSTSCGVMGVLNVTPDSFSDGGLHVALDDALARALAIAEAGARVLDVGGESTRPGAPAVSVEDELARVLPVIEALVSSGYALPISIDTRKAAVAEAALRAGAVVVNDVSGLADPRMVEVCAEHEAGLVVGHLPGDPTTMQRDPRYGEVVGDVYEALARGCERAADAGVPVERLWVDPGIGFGKRLEHNLALLREVARFKALAPVVIGVSRKSMLGELLGGRPTDAAVRGGRLAGGLGAAVWCALQGVSLVRTHDVQASADALLVAEAIVASGVEAAAPSGEAGSS